MKKMVFMAAFVAACVAFVACSNENDLVQQKPEVPEEPTVQYPMTISVTTPTRGTDLTATSLNDFKLYSNIDDSWHNGARFTKVDNQWSNVNSATMGWGTNPNQDYTFYGISDYDNITVVSSNAQIPNVTDTEILLVSVTQCLQFVLMMIVWIQLFIPHKKICWYVIQLPAIMQEIPKDS